jgi:hypothetical protein
MTDPLAELLDELERSRLRRVFEADLVARADWLRAHRSELLRALGGDLLDLGGPTGGQQWWFPDQHDE